MAEGEPLPFSGPRGIQGLRGTISHLVNIGMTHGEVMGTLQSIYSAYGGRWTTQSQEAATRLFQAFNATSIAARGLTNVRGSIAITSRWISYGTLQRNISDFVNSPAYNVRYHVVGNADGAPIDLWRTASYTGANNLPATVEQLRSNLSDIKLPGTDGYISPSDIRIAEVQITAV